MSPLAVDARPFPFMLAPGRTALVIIDMQRDFIEPGGFGAALGNDVRLLEAAIVPDAGAAGGLAQPRLAGGAHARITRRRPVGLPAGQAESRRAGAAHRRSPARWAACWCAASRAARSCPALAPRPGETVIDKPGKGAFHATPLRRHCCSGSASRSWCSRGVTTEVCVQTTMREANDRGYECLLVEEATASYFPAFKPPTIEMIVAQGGIVGWAAPLAAVQKALSQG